MKKDSIVIIDDDVANLKLLQEVLKPFNYHVYLATSAEDGLKLIVRENPDLLISDVNMPGMDGFTLTRKLRESPETRDMPIILITGMDATDLKVKGLEAGCDDFLTKPYDLSELQVRVKSLLKLSYYRRQLSTRQQLDFLAQHMTDGLIITDQDYRIIQINKTAEKLINYNGQDKSVIDLISEQYETEDTSADLSNHPIPYSKILLYRPASTEVNALYLQCEISFVKHPELDEGRVILILKDITDEQVEQRLKHDFISLISHKLRSPIAVIAGMARLIESSFGIKLDKKQKEILGQLKENSIKLELLVDKLIRFSTINNINLLSRQNIPYDPLEIIKESTTHTIYFYSHKTVKTNYKTSLPDNFTYNVLTKDQVSFINDNLVENAIKFSKGQSVEIDFQLWLEDEYLKFSVTDNGPGIPPEAQEKIFKSFYQYEKIFTGNVEGMGIGLAMVKQVIDNIGGRIEVSSELEKGSTFKIYLPIKINFEWNPVFDEWT